MIDVALRRFGVVVLFLTLPGLAVPVFALVQNGIGDLSIVGIVVIAMGMIAAFGMYAALGYLTWRAFRRRATHIQTHSDRPRESADVSEAKSEAGALSRAGRALIIVGGCAFGLAWLSAIADFFVPSQPEAPLFGVLTVLVPGVLSISGFGMALTGLVLLFSRR